MFIFSILCSLIGDKLIFWLLCVFFFIMSFLICFCFLDFKNFREVLLFYRIGELLVCVLGVVCLRDFIVKSIRNIFI